MSDFDYRQGDNETDEKYADRIVRRCDQLESELARPEAATTSDEHAVLDALCHNTGYQRWWIHSGRLHFERDGQPGRIEVLLPYRCEPQLRCADCGHTDFSDYWSCPKGTDHRCPMIAKA